MFKCQQLQKKAAWKVLKIMKNILTKIDCNDIILLPLIEGSFFVHLFCILNNPGREVLAKAKIHGSRARIHRRCRKMRVKITLACSECKQRNYDTKKNKKNDPDRLEMNKYCRFCRKHTLHKETK